MHDIDVAALLVRPATVDDIAAIHTIYAHHVLHGTGSFEETPPGLDEMQGRFQAVLDRGLPYLVAERRGAVKGYAYASPFRPRSAYRYTLEDSIYIDPDSVGLGIGRLLLRSLIDQCAAAGYRQMVAVIGGSENTASIQLHKALGFRTVGVIEASGYKFQRWLDTVLMQRALGEGATVPPGR